MFSTAGGNREFAATSAILGAIERNLGIETDRVRSNFGGGAANGLAIPARLQPAVIEAQAQIALETHGALLADDNADHVRCLRARRHEIEQRR